MTTLYIENEFESTWPKYSKKYAGLVPISMFEPSCRHPCIEVHSESKK